MNERSLSHRAVSRPARPVGATRRRPIDPAVRFVDEATLSMAGGGDLVAALAVAGSAVDGPWRTAAREIVAAHIVGEPLDVVLNAWAKEAGREEAIVAAACWFGHVHAGRPLAALGAAGVVVRERAQLRDDLAVHMSQATASVVALAAAPAVFALVAGVGGISPIGVLLGTVDGRLAVVAAVAFEVLGLIWMRRLVQRVDR